MIPFAALGLLKSKAVMGVALVGGALLIGFLSGMKVSGWRYDSIMLAAEKQVQKAYTEGTNKSLKVASNITVMLNESRLEANEIRAAWKKDLRDAGTELAACDAGTAEAGRVDVAEDKPAGGGAYLSVAGVGVWDSALQSGLPTGFYPGGADGGGQAPGITARIDDAIENLEENMFLCNRLRVKNRMWRQLAVDHGWQVQ